MKKKILTFIFAICLIIPCMIMLTACNSTSPEIEFRVYEDFIQWSDDGKTWNNLVELDDIQGPQGISGKQVEFQTTNTHIQWRYVGETSWKDLALLSEFGDIHTITFDYGASKEFFTNTTETQNIKSGNWITNLPTIKQDFQESFLGWFVQGTEKQIKELDFIGGDIILEARFDREKLGLSGLYQNGKYEMSWSDIAEKIPGFIDGTSLKQCSKSNEFNGEIVIDNSITTIDSYAFNGCSNLTEIIIPNGVTTINSFAFADCTSLKSIKIPATTTSITEGAFSGCSSLESIIVNEENTVYDSRNNCNAIIEKEGNRLLIGCNNTVIPNNVESININAFYGSGIKNVIIPASVNSIVMNPFQDCRLLESIIVDEENTYFDSRNNCNAIIRKSNNELVTGCKATIVPEDVTIIGERAFYGSSITNIILSDNLLTIKEYAFSCCDSLLSITIPSNVTNIETYAFSSCNNLSTVNIKCGQVAYEESVFIYSDSISNVIIDNSEVANSLTYYTTFGRLIYNSKNVYIKSAFDVTGSDLLSIFTKQSNSDKDGYDLYIRN